MVNLNDIVNRQTSYKYKHVEPMELDLRLGNDQFPELDEEMVANYSAAFAQLHDEVIDARPKATKVRVTTSIQTRVQSLIIEHNSSHIEENVLVRLNDELDGCSKGERKYNGRPHGNHIAANVLYKYGAKISIFNINDGEYKVQTKVEIPIPVNTPPIP